MTVTVTEVGVQVTDTGGMAASPATETEGPARFDFRRPSKFSREAIRRLEVAHEVFTRRLASDLGGALRSVVQLEPLAVDQVPYDDYTRSMPNPSMLMTVGLAPLPGTAVIELNVQLGLVLVDRLLGGGGPGSSAARAAELRRPTELETFLLTDLMRLPVAALEEALAPIVGVSAELHGLESNPQLVQVAAPSDMVLLLSYRMTVTHGGVPSVGMLTICYPSAIAVPILERIGEQSWREDAEGAPGSFDTLGAHLDDVEVVLRVGLRSTEVSTADILGLEVGDVLRLDHAPSDHVLARIEDTSVIAGHAVRRGRRLALQVAHWTVEPGTPLPAPVFAEALPSSVPQTASFDQSLDQSPSEPA